MGWRLASPGEPPQRVVMEPSSFAFVRRYEPRDRASVRQICCDTADRGRSFEGFFHDREVFADFLTGYYTDWEPEALWVAEHKDQVIGYVTGCLDADRYRRVMAWWIIPRGVLRGLSRGILCSLETWRLLKAVIKTWQAGGLRVISFEKYPAHLHVNLREDFRGHGMGQRLVERFIQQVGERGLPGLRASVRRDSHSACRFFERMGFAIINRHRVVFPDGGALREHETVVYGKAL